MKEERRSTNDATMLSSVSFFAALPLLIPRNARSVHSLLRPLCPSAPSRLLSPSLSPSLSLSFPNFVLFFVLFLVVCGQQQRARSPTSSRRSCRCGSTSAWSERQSVWSRCPWPCKFNSEGERSAQGSIRENASWRLPTHVVRFFFLTHAKWVWPSFTQGQPQQSQMGPKALLLLLGSVAALCVGGVAGASVGADGVGLQRRTPAVPTFCLEDTIVVVDNASPVPSFTQLNPWVSVTRPDAYPRNSDLYSTFRWCPCCIEQSDADDTRERRPENGCLHAPFLIPCHAPESFWHAFFACSASAIFFFGNG